MQTTSFILRQSVAVWVRTSGYCKSLHLSHFLFLRLYIPLSLSLLSVSLSLSISLSVRPHTHRLMVAKFAADGVLVDSGTNITSSFPFDISWLESFRAVLLCELRAGQTVNHLQFVAITIKGVALSDWFLELWFSRVLAWHEATTPEFMSKNIQSFQVRGPLSLPSVFWCVSCCNCCDLLLVLFVCCCFF